MAQNPFLATSTSAGVLNRDFNRMWRDRKRGGYASTASSVSLPSLPEYDVATEHSVQHESTASLHKVIVGIDFGTTYTGEQSERSTCGPDTNC